MRNWFTFIRIRFSLQTNAFLYYLKKLPGIRLLIPQSVYRYTWLKILVSIFGFLADIIKTALMRNLFAVLAMFWAPRLLMQLLGHLDAANVPLYAFFFVTVFCFLPNVQQSKLFKPSRDDRLFLNHFMMNPSEWYHQKILNNLWQSGVLTAPALLFVFRDAYYVFSLTCIQIAVITASDYVYLRFFRKTAKLPERKKRWFVCVLLALLIYASCPLLHFSNNALSPQILIEIGLAALAICAAFCVPLFRFRNYKSVAVEFASKNAPIFDVRSVSGSEADAMNLTDADEKVCEAQFYSFKHLGSWDYFDKILRKRMAKAFRSQRRQTVLFNTVFAVAGGFLFRFHVFGLQADNWMQYSSFILAAVIGMTCGHNHLELCFRNMDAPLLYHCFYDAATIRTSFLSRFRYLMLNGLFLLALAMADVCAFLLTAGTPVPIGTILTFAAVFTMILFAFETLHLISYYLLQPYAVDNTVKSPVFTAVNTAEGLLTYGILFVRGDIAKLLLPLTLLAALALGAFFLTLQAAPRTFKCRQ